MKILQLTDIHLTTPGQTIGGRDPNANFEKALDHCLIHHQDADAMVITGDLSDWGDKDDYERLKHRIARLPFPVQLCIGNHDDRPAFVSVFPELASGDGFVNYTFPLPLGIGIALDTWAPQTHEGALCAKRLEWLDSVLAANSSPAWLFMHHNFVPNRLGPLDSIMLKDAEAFGRVVERHKHKIRHICHGHCHLPLAGAFHGVSFSAPRGTNHAGWFSFDEDKMLAGSDLPESYAVLHADAGSVMVQMIEFGYHAEVRMEGSPDYAAWDRATMER